MVRLVSECMRVAKQELLQWFDVCLFGCRRPGWQRVCTDSDKPALLHAACVVVWVRLV